MRSKRAAATREYRYESCAQCNRRWSISADRKLYAGYYVCPECDKRNKRGGYR